VRHAQRQLARSLQAAERAELVLAGEEKVELRPHLVRAAGGVQPDGLAQLAEAVDRVVEVRDRLIERVGGEIGQRLLELAEGHGGLVEVLGAARHVEAQPLGDVGIGAPVLARLVDVILLAVSRRKQVDRLLAEAGLRGDEARHGVDVLDELLGVAERDAVDLLHGIFVAVVADHVKRAVDMSVAEGLPENGGALKAKMLQDLFHEKNLNLSLLTAGAAYPSLCRAGLARAGQQTYCTVFPPKVNNLRRFSGR